MIRVHVLCEGQTEETFVREVLRSEFAPKNIALIPALVGKPGHKGGNIKFDRLLKDVELRLLGDRTAYCTTLFDFYGLPTDFPGKQQAAQKKDAAEKADYLLKALTEKLQQKLGEDPLIRFIPYVQMYEFEGLLFSDPEGLARALDGKSSSTPLQVIRQAFSSPEEINDSPLTAPSKRIKQLYPRYDKPLHGSLAALEISLATIRTQCRQFDAWLARLETLLPLG